MKRFWKATNNGIKLTILDALFVRKARDEWLWYYGFVYEDIFQETDL